MNINDQEQTHANSYVFPSLLPRPCSQLFDVFMPHLNVKNLESGTTVANITSRDRCTMKNLQCHCTAHAIAARVVIFTTSIQSYCKLSFISMTTLTFSPVATNASELVDTGSQRYCAVEFLIQFCTSRPLIFVTQVLENLIGKISHVCVFIAGCVQLQLLLAKQWDQLCAH